jgi:hypothetical protein
MMRTTIALRLYAWLLIGCCTLSAPRASSQDLGNKQALLGQARQSYYNLRDRGLASFQCSTTPNWEVLLHDELKSNPDGASAAIKTLSQIRFTTSLAADNSVKLTHNDLPGQSQHMMDALRQIYGGMEQMTSGFFDTWKLFMLSPPFPEVGSQYHLEPLGSQYRLTYKDGPADVVTTMSRDFAITNLQVTTPDFNSSIQPTFTRTSQGWRLNGYEASYQSQKPEEATHLKVLMDYQDIEGLAILKNLYLSGSYGGSPFAVELAFSGCQVTKKQSTALR